jgi:predicted amidohydrolase YtcJ
MEGDTDQAIILANKRSIELGWTQVQDPGGQLRRRCALPETLWRRKTENPNLQGGPWPGAILAKTLRDGPIIEAFGNRFNVRAIKVVSDGALGSRGAALLAPYRPHFF